MKKFNKLIPVMACALLILSSVTIVLGQERNMDRNRLNRDLKIMEGILDKLLQEKSSYRHLDADTRGLYLDGFGILFHAGQDAFGHTRLMLSGIYEDGEVFMESMLEKSDEKADVIVGVRPDRKKEDKDERAEKVEEEDAAIVDVEVPRAVYRTRRKSDEKIREDEKKAIEKMKQSMHVFYKNYSSAIGQLNPSDRIAILVDLKNWKITDSGRGFLTAWAEKQDIQRFRSKQISDSEFNKRVHFKISNGDSDISTDIDIMTEILERGIESVERLTNNGIYMEGLGALFFVKLPGGLYVYNSGETRNVVAIQEYVKAFDFNYQAKDGDDKEEKAEKKKELDKWMKNLKDDLFDLVSSYGHTLRLKPQESVILNVDLGRRFSFWGSEEKQPSHLILKLKKSDLDNYNQGGITLAGLRKKAVIQTF